MNYTETVICNCPDYLNLSEVPFNVYLQHHQTLAMVLVIIILFIITKWISDNLFFRK